MMTLDPLHAEIARYIDRKADVARRYAKNRPADAIVHEQIARVLDALADEIRMGLATDDTPIHLPETGDVL